MITQKETNILRELGQKYMEYAQSPRQKQLEQLWIAHNTRRPAPHGADRSDPLA